MALRLLMVAPCFLFVASVAQSTSVHTLQHNYFNYIGQPNSSTHSILILGGYRYYLTSNQTFMKQDSDSPFLGRNLSNGYQYAGGNPILFEDRSGHCFIGPRFRAQRQREANSRADPVHTSTHETTSPDGFQQIHYSAGNHIYERQVYWPSGLIKEMHWYGRENGLSFTATYTRQGTLYQTERHWPIESSEIRQFGPNGLNQARYYKGGRLKSIKLFGRNRLSMIRGSDVAPSQVSQDMISFDEIEPGAEIVYHPVSGDRVHALLIDNATWLTSRHGACPLCRAHWSTFQLGIVADDPETVFI